MTIPIYMMTRDRPEYLHLTLESLERTKAPFELTIFDDGSTSEKQLELLDEQAHKVIYSQPKGTKQLWIDILKYHFSYREEDYCIHIQDDLFFHPDWLKVLMDTYKNVPNLGILTPWDRRRWQGEIGDGYVTRNVKDGKTCKIGGPCWLTTKPFALKVIEDAKDKKYTRCGFDSAFQKACNFYGFNIAATHPYSYVEHFGIESIAHPGRLRTSIGYHTWNPAPGLRTYAQYRASHQEQPNPSALLRNNS